MTCDLTACMQYHGSYREQYIDMIVIFARQTFFQTANKYVPWGIVEIENFISQKPENQ